MTSNGVTDLRPRSEGEYLDVKAQGYMDLRKLAEYSSIPRRTLLAYVRRPVDPLPCFDGLGKILVDVEAFRAWLEPKKRKAPGNMARLVAEVARKHRRR